MIWYHRSGLHDHILRDVQFYCSSGWFLNWSFCIQKLFYETDRLKLRLSIVYQAGINLKRFSVSRRTSGTQSTNNCSSSRFSWSSSSSAMSCKKSTKYVSNINLIELQLPFELQILIYWSWWIKYLFWNRHYFEQIYWFRERCH